MAAAQDVVRNIRREVREKVHSYPESKTKAKEATNSDVWGPTDDQKNELAQLAIAHHENRALIFRALWKRVEDDSPYWMHVSKGLSVIEYLLLQDVPDALTQINEHRRRLEDLRQNYKSATDNDPMKRDILNENVRAKAARLLMLAESPEKVVEEAAKLRATAARMSSRDSSIGSTSALSRQADLYKNDTSTPPTATSHAATPHAATPHAATPHAATQSPSPERTVPSQAQSQTASPEIRQPVAPHVSSVPMHTTTSSLFDAPSMGTMSSSATMPMRASQEIHFQQEPPQPAFQPQQPVFQQQQTASQNQAQPTVTPPQAQFFVAPPQQAPRQAAPADFDPFADVNQAMAEQRKESRPAPAQSDVTDFFSTAKPAESPSAPFAFVPPPAPTQAARQVTPTPQTKPGDRMTDAMFEQLSGYQGNNTRRPSGQNNDSLQSLMQRPNRSPAPQ
jgi:hypothetical protein